VDGFEYAEHHRKYLDSLQHSISNPKVTKVKELINYEAENTEWRNKMEVYIFELNLDLNYEEKILMVCFMLYIKIWL